MDANGSKESSARCELFSRLLKNSIMKLNNKLRAETISQARALAIASPYKYIFSICGVQRTEKGKREIRSAHNQSDDDEVLQASRANAKCVGDKQNECKGGGKKRVQQLII
jgi:hypothetical protein